METETYNGHKNWESFVVYDYFSNDESIYLAIMDIAESNFSKNDKVKAMFETLENLNIQEKISTHRIDMYDILESFEQTVKENKELKA